ncbi:IS630 family transposase [Metapseudomonas otitidis]|uniref:IS630 family transposase n=1 Tax=Metapseudomonas otitidis TaxID=319939 RepID=UPI0013F69885|nr:IS630 family transposase [Pseudomonas otitidis]
MKTDARKLSPQEQREKRAIALRMREQGYTYKAIAAAVGAHSRTVAHWAHVAESKGEKAAISGGQRGARQGERRSLSSAQEVLVRTLMTDKMPDQLKLGFALWTRDAVRELIRQRCGFLMPVRTVGEYLKRWGYTPQRPLHRAYQQKPEVVQRWLNDEYPRITLRAKAENGEIQWGDETGMRSDSHAGRSYAPIGETPVRQVSGSRFSTNMISTVTNRGKLRFMLYWETLTAPVLIRFLGRLIREAQGRKVFLVLDNLRVHHSKKVSAWVADHKEQIELFFLPAYAPELNPDEYLNCDLKNQVRTGLPARNQEELEGRVRSAMRRLQLRPQRVRSYFRHPHIAYAA